MKWIGSGAALSQGPGSWKPGEVQEFAEWLRFELVLDLDLGRGRWPKRLVATLSRPRWRCPLGGTFPVRGSRGPG